jgi:uncharacterized protein (TIRG00374 family)
LFGLLVLGFVVVLASDEKEVLDHLLHAEGLPLAAAVLGTCGSMCAIALSYRNLFVVTGHPIPFRRLFGITLVCNAFNNILSSGGLSGTAVRCLLLKREGVPNTVTLPVSLALGMLSNILMAGICAFVVLPLWKPAMEQGFPVGRVVSLGIFSLMGLALVQAGGFFMPKFRRLLMRSVDGLLDRLARRWKIAVNWRVRVDEINRKLDRSAHLLGGKRSALIRSFLWIGLDWACYLFVLGACFAAVGQPMSPKLLMMAFAAVFLTTEIGFTPSGLGVAEGVVAWMLFRRGIAVEHSLAAMLLFRVTYFALPVVTAMVFQLDRVREGLRRREETQ